MRGTFSVSLHDLDAAGKRYQSDITAPWLLGALEGTGVDPAPTPGTVDLRYAKSGNDVIVRGTVRAAVVVPCARCLTPTTLELTGELSLLLVPETSKKAKFAKGKEGPAEGEISATDAELDTYSGEELSFDPFIREALLLEVPPFPLCSDTCQGIRPPPDEADKGPTIDPRLAPLLELSAKRPKKNDRKD